MAKRGTIGILIGDFSEEIRISRLRSSHGVDFIEVIKLPLIGFMCLAKRMI